MKISQSLIKKIRAEIEQLEKSSQNKELPPRVRMVARRCAADLRAELRVLGG